VLVCWANRLIELIISAIVVKMYFMFKEWRFFLNIRLKLQCFGFNLQIPCFHT
jgi:hypothetical protein